jgi:hypothetical protein
MQNNKSSRRANTIASHIFPAINNIPTQDLIQPKYIQSFISTLEQELHNYRQSQQNMQHLFDKINLPLPCLSDIDPYITDKTIKTSTQTLDQFILDKFGSSKHNELGLAENINKFIINFSKNLLLHNSKFAYMLANV